MALWSLSFGQSILVGRAEALGPSLTTACEEQDRWIWLAMKQKLWQQDKSCLCSTSRGFSESYTRLLWVRGPAALRIAGLQGAKCGHTTGRCAIHEQTSIQLLSANGSLHRRLY